MSEPSLPVQVPDGLPKEDPELEKRFEQLLYFMKSQMGMFMVMSAIIASALKWLPPVWDGVSHWTLLTAYLLCGGGMLFSRQKLQDDFYKLLEPGTPAIQPMTLDEIVAKAERKVAEAETWEQTTR